MKRKQLLVLLGSCLLASLLCNVVLFEKAVSRMRLEASVRLAPTFLVYREANRELAPVREKVDRVILFGDSRIHEWTGLSRHERFEFVNRGIGGETTAQMLGRLETDVIALQPAFAVLQFGVNDLKQYGVLGSGDELGEQTWARMKQMTHRLRATGITPIVMTIFPVGEIPWKRRPVWSSTTQHWIRTINGRLRDGELGDGIHTWDCDAFFDQKGKMNPVFARDELHLNAAGYEELSRRLIPLLENLQQADLLKSSSKGSDE